MSQKLKVTVPATNEELATTRKYRLNRHEQECLMAVQIAQQGEWESYLHSQEAQLPSLAG